MVLKFWEAQEFVVGNNRRLYDANIFDCHRDLYVFIDETIYKTYGEVSVGRAILINYSLSKTLGIADRCDYRSNNNHLMLFNLYVFDVEFVNGVKNIKEAIFTLISAKSSSTTNIWDTAEPRSYIIGNSVYTSSVINDDTIMDFFEDVEANNTLIPEPLYYTIEHMDKMTRNYQALNSNRSLYMYTGNQLIDQNTKIRVLDSSKWDSFYTDKMMTLDSYRDDDVVDKVDISEIPDALFNITTSSMISGLMYGYDSNDGYVKIAYDPSWGVHIPFAKAQVKSKVENEIKTIQNTMENLCKSVEKEFGNIQMFYSPGKAGDRVSSNFRDYLPDNQPSVDKLDIDKQSSFNNNINATVFQLQDMG